MRFEDDFKQDMQHLIQILKKALLKQGKDLENTAYEKGKKDSSNDASVNINVYVFPVMALTPEEIEELEQGTGFSSQDSKNEPELSTRLTDSDLEFLKDHGITF